MFWLSFSHTHKLIEKHAKDLTSVTSVYTLWPWWYPHHAQKSCDFPNHIPCNWYRPVFLCKDASETFLDIIKYNNSNDT